MCLGRQLAVAELKVAIALLVVKYNLRTTSSPLVLDYSQPNIAVVKVMMNDGVIYIR